jgi:hypothetical protein
LLSDLADGLGGLLSGLVGCLYSLLYALARRQHGLLGGLRGLMDVLLTNMRCRTQRLLVEPKRRV